MAITYNWTIANLEHNVADGGVTRGADVAKILAAQDALINSSPIPEDYQDDKYWV
jgi:hypothetical protein